MTCGLYVSPLVLRMCRPDPLLSNTPAWKCLIERSLTPDECTSLIADIFSDRDEAEAVKHLHGDNAQSFVDVIDEVLPIPYFKNGPIDQPRPFPVPK